MGMEKERDTAECNELPGCNIMKQPNNRLIQFEEYGVLLHLQSIARKERVKGCRSNISVSQ